MTTLSPEIAANDFCKEGKRQTISAQDVIAAMKELEFDEFVEPLERFLEAHRKDLASKKTAAPCNAENGMALAKVPPLATNPTHSDGQYLAIPGLPKSVAPLGLGCSSILRPA